MIAFALIPVVVLAYLLWRSDRRFDEAEKAWRQERVSLLNRIQRPEIAGYEVMGEPSTEPLHVPLDVPAAHDDYVERRATGELV